jgi:hypothetical protein
MGASRPRLGAQKAGHELLGPGNIWPHVRQPGTLVSCTRTKRGVLCIAAASMPKVYSPVPKMTLVDASAHTSSTAPCTP